MKRYKIEKDIVVSFLTRRDQVDCTLGGGFLECDGTTIWAVVGGVRRETNTMAYAVGLWLEQGSITEVPGT